MEVTNFAPELFGKLLYEYEGEIKVKDVTIAEAYKPLLHFPDCAVNDPVPGECDCAGCVS